MFLTVIHVLPDGYKPSLAKRGRACFIVKYRKTLHANMLECFQLKNRQVCVWDLCNISPLGYLFKSIEELGWGDEVDHFHLSIVKEMFRLSSRDYSVYWHVMLSPSKNLCILTGQERDSLHIAFGWWCLFYSIQKLLLYRVVNLWN